MKFGGWHQCSLIDFPEKISTVLFTEGCSFRCPFCHNPNLVLPNHFTKTPISENEVLSFLEKRKGKIDGITITGGEPTIHKDLETFIRKTKALGLLVKLDTNGSNPTALEHFLQKDLVDYVAMDIKSSFQRYSELAGVIVSIPSIEKSIHLLINSQINYEFRSTIIKELHNAEEIIAMAKSITGAKRYFLQKFRPDVTLDKTMCNLSSYSDEKMDHLCQITLPFVKECKWR